MKILARDVIGRPAVETQFSGQSYKGSTIVNLSSRVVIWGIFKSVTTLES